MKYPDFSKKPFALIIIPIIIGILVAKFFPYHTFVFWLGCLFLFFTLITLKVQNFRKLTSLFLLLSLTAFMVVRWNTTYTYPENYIAFKNYTEIKSVTGLVVQAKIRNDLRNKYIVKVKTATKAIDQFETCGNILLNTYKIKQQYEVGDILHLKCNLRQPKGKRNPGQFDYKNYLVDQDVHLVCYINHNDSITVLQKNAGNIFSQWIIEPLKNYFSQIIDSYISEENSSLLKALLIGDRQELNPDLLEKFKNVGVVHVLAISGLHVGFIIIFVLSILSLLRLKYNHQIIVLLIILFVFVTLINFKAPVLRASLMAGLYFLAKIYQRKVSLFNIIFFVACLLLIIDPRDLFDPGFQFSFVAVLSIVYGYPKLNKMIPVKSKLNFKRFPLITKFFSVFVWDAFLVSLSAVLGTLPLTIYYYGIIPTYALLANIIIIPLIGMIVILGLFLLISALISGFISASIGNLINLSFSILKSVISFFFDLPHSNIYISTPSLVMILLFMLLIFLLFNINKKKYQILSIAVLVIATLMILHQAHESKYLKVTFLDVGQGDASFVQFPNGESMLIDGGDATKEWDQGKNAILPFLRYNDIYRIKYVVASHAHNDHIGGLIEILKSIRVDTLVLNAYKYNTKKFNELIETNKKNNIPIRYVSKGDMLFPDSKCRVYIVHPTQEFVKADDYSGEECNNSSIVLKIQYGENGILFTGDAEKAAEGAYTSYGDFLESEIIKTGHHGSKTSSTQLMLDYVDPLVAIISVAERNKFRHPSPFTLEKFHQNNIKPFLTSDNGAIQFKITPTDIHLNHWNKNAVKFF